ncbi:MAG: acyl-CoA carboxylase subunit beta [Deltaproteobacteria bacterium]|nr:MAG: acyl-CoA carboxylase subunit beta [Deltaproteobacteria bacterium]
MRERVEELERRRAAARAMGGPAKIAKQHARGKLTARERLALLFDGGAFFEIGLHGRPMGPGAEPVPADAVVCGWGKVRGRHVAAAAYDFTVKGGSIGPIGEVKVTRLRELALRCRMPMVWLVDSAGARIDPKAGHHGDTLSLFAGAGALFREQVVMSGVVPQVAAMVGPGAAGTAYIPGLADFVPMVRERSSMALAGPPLVRAATGQEVSAQELGGSRVHTSVSGVADVEVDSDEACIELVKEYLSYMPQHSGLKPPVVPCDDPIDRADDALLDVLPDNPRSPYDMVAVIRAVVDHGITLDIKPAWARSIVTCLARLGGYPCGVVANNPRHLGGILTSDAADKAARFIQICDAFNLPLVFLMDVPGFMVGSQAEHGGIIRHGAKMLHAMAAATVPKLTVVVRKGYGAGYFVMAGRAFEPDLIVAWPGAEISVMGAEGMVEIAAPKLFGDAPPAPDLRKRIVDAIAEHIDIYKVAGWGLIDDVIDPRETRRVLCEAIAMSWSRVVERPHKKRGVMPV